jgi:acyl-CoA thioester hydrolase
MISANSPITDDSHSPFPQAKAPLHVASISVRWRDLDAFNHVNNASYLTYLEEARLQWLRQIPAALPSAQATPVLAASQLNYRSPINWPAQLDVQLFCTRLGNSSITLSHRIVDAGEPERLYCDGSVTMVWINPASGKPVSLPEALRAAADSSQIC